MGRVRGDGGGGGDGGGFGFGCMVFWLMLWMERI